MKLCLVSIVKLSFLVFLSFCQASIKTTVEMLKDQATVSDAYIANQNKQCDMHKLCTHDEMNVSSICGSDGRTYNSMCEIKKAVCYGNPVVKESTGPCPAKSKCKLERAFQQNLAIKHNKSAHSLFIPECEQDGDYSIVQCHQSTGYCWCVTITGRPLPGTSVRFKTPNCLPYGKKGRRTARRRLGRPRRGCNTDDRSTFNANLIKIFRAEFDRDPKNKFKSGIKGLRVSMEKRIITWKFNQLDKNRNERLSRREIRGLKRLVRKHIQPRPCARLFTRYCDLDQDKKITRREWYTCLGVDINRLAMDYIKVSYITHQVFSSLNSQNGLLAATKTKPSLLTSMQRDPPAYNSPYTGMGNLHSASVWASSPRENSGSDFLLRENLAQKNSTGTQTNEDEQADCGSQRQRALESALENSGSGVYIPECTGTDNKHFAHVQCHKSAKYCWCAEPETGKPIPNTSVRYGKPTCQPKTNSPKEIKGCKPHKKDSFYRRLHSQMQTSRIASGNDDSSDGMSVKELAVRWKFRQLDTNNNARLEKREWRVYRREIKSWHGVKKCGRNFMRFCDKNKDRKITLDEWLECTEFSIPPRTPSGPNPFTDILNPD